jgi:hypothetical protein
MALQAGLEDPVVGGGTTGGGHLLWSHLNPSRNPRPGGAPFRGPGATSDSYTVTVMSPPVSPGFPITT